MLATANTPASSKRMNVALPLPILDRVLSNARRRAAPYVSLRLFAAPSKPQLRLRQLSPQLAQTRGKTVIVPVDSQPRSVTRADGPVSPKSTPRKPCISTEARTLSQYRCG